MGGNKFAPARRFAGSGAMEELWQVKNNIWLLGKTSRKRPDDKASTKKDAPRARSASGKEAEVTTLSHSAHFVSWVFATVNFLNNAMLAIIFLQWRISSGGEIHLNVTGRWCLVSLAAR